MKGTLLALGLSLLSSLATAAPHADPAFGTEASHKRMESRPISSKRAPTTTNKTIVQLFQWNWDSVAAECTNWLGPAGYGFAQVSPPAEHITGTQWWTDYQPVSHIIDSKRGNRTQFENMVTVCKDAGVGIIVDAILNLASGSGGTGVAGSTWTNESFPAVPFTPSEFHDVCSAQSTETEIWTCQLDSLPDLRTETDTVRSIQAAYLSDLMSMGVVGFRLDAARSMDPKDIAAFLAKLSSKPYITQETWGGSPVPDTLYTGNGDVIEFGFPSALETAFVNGGGLSTLLNWPESGWASSDNANVFVADHDTERTSGYLNSDSGNNAYTLSTIFLLAQAYGSPTILSGYDFTSSDQGAPLDSNNNVEDTTCFSSGWRCEQRWTAISNMVQFHNAVDGQDQVNAASGTSNQITFGRGSIGQVAINYESSSWDLTGTTNVPDGSYCEIIHDTDASFTTCSSSNITVSGGKFTVTIPAYDAIAFYSTALASTTSTTSASTSSTATSSSAAATASATATSASNPSVTFLETATTSVGQTVYITGSVAELGNWTPSDGVALADQTTGNSQGTWKATVTLPASTTVAYKFVIVNSDGTVASWESDPNRSLDTGTSDQTVTTTWR
ncbi:hypothetical protein RQP46_011349 [Phenoliferia psychrophenolica]